MKLFKNTKPLVRNLLLLGIIFLVGFFALRHTFSLTLVGDDWLAFYRFQYHVGKWSNGQLNFLTSFLTPYGAQDLTMGLLAKTFGYNSLAFFIVSFLLRGGGSVALFIVVNKLAKNSIAAFISGLFFFVSSVGLDATSWVFNMPSYASLIAISFFIYFFIKSQTERKLLFAGYAAVFYFLSYLLAPIRIHGIPIFAIALEVFFILKTLLILKERKYELKKELVIVILRQLLMAGVLIGILYIGASRGIGSNLTQRIKEGYDYISLSAKNGDFTFFLNPVIIFGRFFLPETVLQSLLKSLWFLPQRPFWLSLILFSPFIYLSARNRKKDKNLVFTGFLSLLIIWTLIVRSILYLKPSYLDPTLAIPAYLGGYLVVFWFYLLITNIRKSFSTILFASVAWTFSGFLFPWLWTPNSLFGTFHRYLIMSSLGVSIFCATLFLAFSHKKVKWLVFFILALLIGIQFDTTNRYFSYLSTVRNRELNDKIWTKLSKIEAVGKEETPLVFYFEGENNAIIYYLITFGFPPHVGILYDIKDLNKLPVPLDRWEDAVKVISTGENLPAYGYKAKPTPVKNFYAFRLKADGNLEDITAEKRKELSKILLIKNSR